MKALSLEKFKHQFRKASEDHEAPENQWKNITCGADAAEFVGKFVVFESNTPRFNHGSLWCKSGSPTRFAYISDRGDASDVNPYGYKDKGPLMERVINPKYRDQLGESGRIVKEPLNKSLETHAAV